ncbi:hypothetical protein B0J11DRAFT_523031 [Dendryphion nanum]|uniref:Glycosyltransferase 2 n=1 Tax=Dendryphion nanum TaxID=256645 RepID=A0A9P9E1R3_9PLEO|nr:hypothetical protein B0J11DRAFT_523031 [Dendryphion nanum]
MAGGHRSKQHGWLHSSLLRSTMLGKVFRPTDEELGKKDDDHKPGATSIRGGGGQGKVRNFFPSPHRWRRRRILLTVVGIYLVYLLWTSTPELSSLFEKSGSNVITSAFTGGSSKTADKEPIGAPPGLHIPPGGSTLNTFGGTIKFYRLAASLQSASHTHGYTTTNRNVLFAISSLKSAAVMLPMICEMSKWKRNWVHVAFMGRDDIPIDDLLDINGVDRKTCPAIWHDARPNYAEYSTELRAETSAMAALGHLNTYQHPQVIITNDALEEDGFFTRAVRARAKKLGTPVIEIPKDCSQDFMWITRLDSGSLRSWYKPTVDIVIQAPSHSSGGIIRLLKSLRNADYTGLQPPRLTIDLPSSVDETVNQFLQTYHWPPTPHALSSPTQLTIRRRITPHHRESQEESTIRFLETFYPTNTANSHLLLLSPQVQLSPLYMHYLYYILLEYKHSSYGDFDAFDLVGASLSLPTTLLDAKTALVPPKPRDMNDSRYQRLFASTPNTQFLWQAPSSHATLFFGDKWVEFHSFLSGRVRKGRQARTDKKKKEEEARAKIVAEDSPAWTEYLLELLRARGYAFLYPATSSREAFATVHNELFQGPPEFQALNEEEEGEDVSPNTSPEAFQRVSKSWPSTPIPPPPEAPLIPHSRALHTTLPFEGDLPEIPHLPVLLYTGEITTPVKSSVMAAQYADAFRESVGGCTVVREGKHRRVVVGSADDLFCFGDEDEEEWISDVEFSSVESSVDVSVTAPVSSAAMSTTMSTVAGMATGV